MFEILKYSLIISLFFTWCLMHKACCSYKSEELENLNHILNSILNESIFHQVAVLFQEQTCAAPIIKSVAKNIYQKKAAILIGATASGDFTRYKNSASQHMLNPRRTTFILTVFCLDSNDTVSSPLDLFKNSIEFIVSLHLRRTRPLCLFVLDVRERFLTGLIKDMLNYAWLRSFLDLTIVQLYSDDARRLRNLTVHSYNPFTNVYSSNLYSANMDLFPNKLHNMHRYSLAIAIIRRPPAVNFKIDSKSGRILEINGSDYGTFIILSEFLNFTIKWVPFTVKSFSEPVVENRAETILDMILSGDVDIGGNQVYQHLALKNDQRQGERSIVTYVDDFLGLVPIFPSPTWHISYGTVAIMINVLTHVSLVYGITKILKFGSKFWLPHHILQVLLGTASPKLPTKITERVLFVFLIFLSLYYSAELYANLTDLNLLEHDDGPFFTYRDLIRSNLTIEMHPDHINMTFQNDDNLLSGLEKKVKYVSDTMNCPDRLLKNKSVACLIDRAVARAKILWDSRLDRPSMKLLEPIWSAPKGFIFSEASPYVIEFNRVMRHIHESAMWYRWMVHEKKKCSHTLSARIEVLEDSDRYLMKKMKIVYCSGCVLAFVAFVSELVTARVNEYLFKTK